jgi:hypothetical protein
MKISFTTDQVNTTRTHLTGFRLRLQCGQRIAAIEVLTAHPLIDVTDSRPEAPQEILDLADALSDLVAQELNKSSEGASQTGR